MPCVTTIPSRWLAAVLLIVPLSATHATEPSAGEWLRDCRGYLAALEGEEASDLDITYCAGLTVGILAGLGTGARIGAVSMASALTVRAGLDEDEVLEVIRGMGRRELLGVCAPEEVPTGEIVQAVARHVGELPDRDALPVTAAFFETLQARYPCESPRSDAPDSGP